MNLILAADTTPFFNTGIGKIIQALLVGVGVIIVLWSALKSVGKISQGKIGDAVKGIIGAVVVAAFCFQPELIGSVIDFGGTIVSSVISSFSGLASNSGTSTTTVVTTVVAGG
jgi:hypothetical protein